MSVGVVTVTVCGKATNVQWEEELFVLLYYAGQARDKKTNHMATALQCSVQQCTQHFLVDGWCGTGCTREVTNHKSSQ